MKFLKNFWNKKEVENKLETPTSSDNTFIDIIISLNKKLEVDLSLYIDCDYKKANIDLIDYILVCSKFLNFDENKLKKQIIDILDSQIKNSDNKNFINGLVTVLDKEITLCDDNNFYIKPSQVFIKHIHEHQ